MAKEASFDVVSEVDMQEVANAVNQSQKEISQRYDFKGSKSSLTIEKDDIHIATEDDMRLKNVIDILQSKMHRRGVPISNLSYGKVEPSGGMVKQTLSIQQGIDRELARKITKDIKDTKVKVQSQIMDDKLRVSAKKIDDLQRIIAFLKEKDYGIALQYVNFRS